MSIRQWLLEPVEGARKYTLSALEWLRAFFSGTGVLAMLGMLQYAGENLHLLNLDPATAEKILYGLAVATFVCHLGWQFFQGPPPNPEV